MLVGGESDDLAPLERASERGRRVPADRGGRQHGLGAASVPLGADGPEGIQRPVPDEADARVLVLQARPVRDAPVAHAHADRDDREVGMAGARPEPVLNLRVGGQVVCDEGRQAGRLGHEGSERDVVPLEEGRRLDGAVGVHDAADSDADRVDAVGRAGTVGQVRDRSDDADGGEGVEGDSVGVSRGRLQVDDGGVECAIRQLDAQEVVRGGDDVEGDGRAAGGALGRFGYFGEEARGDELRRDACERRGGQAEASGQFSAAERAVDEDFERDRRSELVFGLPGHDHSFLVKKRLHVNLKFA